MVNHENLGYPVFRQTHMHWPDLMVCVYIYIKMYTCHVCVDMIYIYIYLHTCIYMYILATSKKIER